MSLVQILTRCRINPHFLRIPYKCLDKTLTDGLLLQHISIRRLSVSSRLLADRRYSEKHEWVSKSGSVGTVGISHYAQESLGDVVYVQLPDPDTQFNAGDEVGAVESVKAASEIYTPVSGKITEVNKSLEDKPGLVNTSCYDEGWLFKISLSDESQYQKLMDETEYKKYLEGVRK